MKKIFAVLLGLGLPIIGGLLYGKHSKEETEYGLVIRVTPYGAEEDLLMFNWDFIMRSFHVKDSTVRLYDFFELTDAAGRPYTEYIIAFEDAERDLNRAMNFLDDMFWALTCDKIPKDNELGYEIRWVRLKDRKQLSRKKQLLK